MAPITSLQLRQEKEEALKNNDKYWEKRLKQLEANHGEIHVAMDKEYKKAVRFECFWVKV